MTGNQTLGQQFLNYANIYSPVGPQAYALLVPRARPSEGVSWAAVAKVKAPDASISFFQGDSGDQQGSRGEVQRWCLLLYVP